VTWDLRERGLDARIAASSSRGNDDSEDRPEVGESIHGMIGAGR
jgi:hypothetical protein